MNNVFQNIILSDISDKISEQMLVGMHSMTTVDPSNAKRRGKLNYFVYKAIMISDIHRQI